MKRPGRSRTASISPIRLSDVPGKPLIGVYHPTPLGRGRGEAGHILPADRRVRQLWRVPAGAASGAGAGELVAAEELPRRGFGPRLVRIVERLGRFDGVESLNLIAVRTLDLPEEFSAAALDEAASAGAASNRGREDLRALPLVTIDGADARDFDDAVFAEPRADGFRIIVAIADVGHYVRPGGALDLAARERGNSIYLPGRVLPMLPPLLSEVWCSLRPGVDRAVLFVEIFVDAEGRKLRHRFGRALIRSAARLTYEQLQQAAESGHDSGLPRGTVGHLYAAWRALGREREQRRPLDLELPEHKVLLDAGGRVQAVVTETRHDSHRLIEDFMILANVAAAEEMLSRNLPGLYRVHGAPAVEKLASLRSFLEELGAPLAADEAIRAGDLAAALAPLAGSAMAGIAAERVLQSLPEAGYAPANGGHFGLALTAYAHFTSPIRRYADLLVHRALIAGLALGEGGTARHAAPPLAELAAHLRLTERRAVEAERAVLARAQAALLADQVGTIKDARISGVTRSALFVKIAASGADGILPVSGLPRDFWRYDSGGPRLTGARSGLCFAFGQNVKVRLVEACRVNGRLVFALMSGSGRSESARVPASALRGGQHRSR